MLGELRYLKGKRLFIPLFRVHYPLPTERQDLSKAIKQGPSPSETVKSATAMKEAVLDPTGPRYGRPMHRFGPPTALFSPPLALLKYNLGHLESFTPNHAMLSHALDLIDISTAFFANENAREGSLKTILGHLLVGQSQWQSSITEEGSKKSIKADGVWLEDSFVYLIFELKNESGLGGDPLLQGLTVYGKITAQDKVPFSIVP